MRGARAGPDPSLGIEWTLALLDEGRLAALAVHTREHIVRSLNASLERCLGVDARQLEDEPVHAIVARGNHDLVEAMLDAIESGVNVGPTRIALRPPGADEARSSIWSRISGVPRAVRATVVLLCQPTPAGDGEGSLDPLDRGGEAGYGRIPPSPRWRSRAWNPWRR